MAETQSDFIAALRQKFIEHKPELSSQEMNSQLLQIALDEKSHLDQKDSFSMKVLQKVATERYYYDGKRQKPAEVAKEFNSLKQERLMLDEAKTKLLKVSQDLFKQVGQDNDLRLVIDKWYRGSIADVERTFLNLIDSLLSAIKWIGE